MSRKISIGSLLVPHQTIDVVGPLDLLVNINKRNISLYSQMVPDLVPASLIDSAPEVSYQYIGLTMDPVLLTCNFHAQPTCTVDDCPKLDCLIIGGTLPQYGTQMPEPFRKFLLERCKEVTTVFTNCTGALILGSATDVLDGLKATTNHAFIPMAEQMAPKVHWQKDPMWVVDKDQNGIEFWTASGAVAGMDMMAAWMKQEFGSDLLNISTMMLDYGPRDVMAKPVDFMNGNGEMVKVS